MKTIFGIRRKSSIRLVLKSLKKIAAKKFRDFLAIFLLFLSIFWPFFEWICSNISKLPQFAGKRLFGGYRTRREESTGVFHMCVAVRSKKIENEKYCYSTQKGISVKFLESTGSIYPQSSIRSEFS